MKILKRNLVDGRKYKIGLNRHNINEEYILGLMYVNVIWLEKWKIFYINGLNYFEYNDCKTIEEI